MVYYFFNSLNPSFLSNKKLLEWSSINGWVHTLQNNMEIPYRIKKEMGQQEVIDCLEESRFPLSAKEIADKLGWEIVRVVHIINKMIKYDDIKCIELNRRLAMKFYSCKRKMRLYYV